MDQGKQKPGFHFKTVPPEECNMWGINRHHDPKTQKQKGFPETSQFSSKNLLDFFFLPTFLNIY